MRILRPLLLLLCLLYWVLQQLHHNICSASHFFTSYNAMKFGQYLHDNKYPEWADQYLDYDALKKIIKSLEQVCCVAVT